MLFELAWEYSVGSNVYNIDIIFISIGRLHKSVRR